MSLIEAQPLSLTPLPVQRAHQNALSTLQELIGPQRMPCENLARVLVGQAYIEHGPPFNILE